MKQKLASVHLKAWELLLAKHSVVLRKIEKDLNGREGLIPLHWYDVLLVLKKAAGGKLRFNEIADRIVLSRSALTRSIDKLAAAGLLKKETAGEDRRGRYATITPKGRRMQQATWTYYRRAIQKYFTCFFSASEAEMLVTLLRKIPS